MKLRSIDYLIGASSLTISQKAKLLRLSVSSSTCSSEVDMYTRLEMMEAKGGSYISLDASYGSSENPLSHYLGVECPIEEILDEVSLHDTQMAHVGAYLGSHTGGNLHLKVDDLFYADLECLTRGLMQGGEVVSVSPMIPGFSFKERRRCYEGNPLDFFRQHYIGSGMTRMQLRQEDCRLYKALERAGQLDKALPLFRGYSAADREVIISVHSLFGGNAVAASVGLGKPRGTISKIWHEAGLPASRKKK